MVEAMSAVAFIGGVTLTILVGGGYLIYASIPEPEGGFDATTGTRSGRETGETGHESRDDRGIER